MLMSNIIITVDRNYSLKSLELCILQLERLCDEYYRDTCCFP